MRLGILRGIPIVALAVVSLIAGSTPASANHSWSTYHWARTSNPFTLQLGNNMSSLWPSYLGQTSTDWNANTTAFPTVLTTAVVAGTSGGNCRAVAGTTQVCNKNYGFNGWLGLASIWISGGHITQGTAKMNDSYFGLSTYNNPNEKQHVVCQEVAHTFGLAHQDESVRIPQHLHGLLLEHRRERHQHAEHEAQRARLRAACDDLRSAHRQHVDREGDRRHTDEGRRG